MFLLFKNAEFSVRKLMELDKNNQYSQEGLIRNTVRSIYMSARHKSWFTYRAFSLNFLVNYVIQITTKNLAEITLRHLVVK